eukprot:TRINITY_DN21143_c0_g1_i2.p2 TRINITY_DN21143_c0_g1~~TRINITY_DN21143_c0_g1_i2.p2  ORF type:complete len:103 (-),score=9.85 TRINITY_DN21143_c0_g1_i2:8-316(-)
MAGCLGELISGRLQQVPEATRDTPACAVWKLEANKMEYQHNCQANVVAIGSAASVCDKAQQWPIHSMQRIPKRESQPPWQHARQQTRREKGREIHRPRWASS